MTYNNFKFVKTSNYDDDTYDSISVEFNEGYLDKVVSRFEEFLRGCGYVFDSLNLVSKETRTPYEDPNYDYDGPLATINTGCCGGCKKDCS